VRAALLYLVLSVVWLLLIGYLSSSFFDQSADRQRWQLIGGYAWVLVSAGWIFFAPVAAQHPDWNRAPVIT
jgi:hypothetical protein